MGTKRDIPNEVRAQISVLSKEGLSQRQIATRLKVCQSAVSRCLRRIGELKSYNSRQRSGRPRITSIRDDNAIRRTATAHPLFTSRDVASALPPETKVSLRTIRRRLSKEMGLKSYRPAVKPRLSKKNITDRIKFCKKYQHWTPDQWKQVLFTDEASIKQFEVNHGRVRRPANQRYRQRFTVPCVKHSQSLMVWGSISATGPQELWIQPQNTTINAQGYLQILQNSLQASLEAGGCHYLLQDGAPCHSARLVKTWLQQQGVQLIGPWPGSSPDLNVIENCWGILKKKISSHRPSSIADLEVKIRGAWTSISPDYCQKLVSSMPARIKSVLKAKGHSSSY